MTTAPLLLSVFSTFDAGGAQTRFVTLANHFGRALRHAVIAMDGRYGCADRLKPDLAATFHDVSVTKGRAIGNRRAFRRVLKEIRPDILVTHNWGTIEWAIANFPKLSRHIHMEDGFGPDEAERQLRRRVWTRRLVLRGSTVVVPSLALYDIARGIWRLPEAKVRFVPNGIDCARFDAGPPEVSERLPATKQTIIGTVAALRTEKNLMRLLRSAALLRGDAVFRLVIAGDGPERNRLESLARELGVGDNTTFLGHVPDSGRLYGEFDVFALTSDTEQMPFTVLEAMAAGRAIVATDVGDIRKMVAPPNLPYIVGRDENAVAEGLRHLIADPDLRRRIGEANKKRAVAVYDQERMFQAFAQICGLSPVGPP